MAIWKSIIKSCMFKEQMFEVAVVQQVVYWLIRRKARVRIPGQTSKRNTKSISSTISSQQISGKTLRINKIAMKTFSKNLSFGVNFKLQVPPLMYKLNTHNISGVRNQVNNSDCVCLKTGNISHFAFKLKLIFRKT